MKYFLAIVLLLSGPLALAAKKGIGPAGCGLGNMVFGKDSQILAATTNGTFASQMFGITTGTSGCVDKGSMAQLDAFVEANQVALSNDMARGNGETLLSLSSILGCQDSNAVSQALKQNYDGIFATPQPQAGEISEGILRTLSTEQVSCDRLG